MHLTPDYVSCLNTGRTFNSTHTPSPFPGKLVVFEGVDGSGKTTAIKTLSDILSQGSLGKDGFITVSLPSRTDYGAAFRTLLHDSVHQGVLSPELVDNTRLILLLLDFDYVTRTVIEPALQAGKLVICDRYVHSALAYQSVVGSGESVILANELSRIALEPDLVILFSNDPADCLARLAERGAPDEFENLEKQENVAKQYLALSELPNWCVVDASGSPGDVLWEVIDNLRVADIIQ